MYDQSTANHANSESIDGILNASLEYSALCAGALELDCYEFSIAEALRCAVAEHEAVANAAGVKLSLRLEGTMARRALGDARRLRQMVSQLVGYAVRFEDAGEVEVTARISDGSLFISVKDASARLEPAMAEIIVQSFRRIEHGLPCSAAGLGLALAQKIAVLFGGRITLQSCPDSGSEFTIRLPLSDDEQYFHASARAGRRLTVLIVDGGAGPDRLRSVLRSGGFAVHSVGGAECALEAAETILYDLVLVNLTSTGEDGSRAISRIRKMPGYERTPVLALPAGVCDDDRNAYASRGVQGFISKAVGGAELIADVSRYLAYASAG
jgi:CheY-like chemotaxis protein